MPKFSESISTDYRSRYKEKNKRHFSKNSSFQPLFNSDEFYNPVYTESVTSIEQQLSIVSTGSAQNATQALNSLSFLLNNPFQQLSNSDTVSIGICGELLYFSVQTIQQLFVSQGWNIEFFSKKNSSTYTHILVGIRPTEVEMEHINSVKVPLTVEYHCKRYFERLGIPTSKINFTDMEQFISRIITYDSSKEMKTITEISSILFAFELFGSSKVLRVKAREFLKDCLNDQQKDAMRLHWFKQPTRYSYNPKFFADVSNFIETVQLDGVLFQETAFQLTTLPTTQELLASSQAPSVLQSMVETTFRTEFFQSISGVTLKNIDKLFLQLSHFKEVDDLQYLSFQQCEVSSFVASSLPSIHYLTLQDITISENDFCIVIESLPKLSSLFLQHCTITPSRNSQMYRLKFPQCLHIQISHLHYEFSNEVFKKIVAISTLQSLTIEDYSLQSSLLSVQFSSTSTLEELTILGVQINDIASLSLPATTIHSLTIRSTGIQSLLGLENLTSLRNIQISDEIIENIDSIAKCQNLESLSLRSCGIEHFPLQLLHCPQLHTIDLSSNSLQNIEVRGNNRSKLQRLILSNNQIQSVLVSNFPKLEFIYLSKNALSSLPTFVKRVKNKSITIDIFENPITPEEIQEAIRLIRKGWRIICSLPIGQEELNTTEAKTIE